MSANRNHKAIIIGGGIGGLCTAIALRQKGIETAVFERAAALKEVGAGLSLWANAIKALNKIGVGEALKKISVSQSNGGVRNSRGGVLASAKGNDANGNKVTLVIVVHRAELLDALLKKLGADSVSLNA